MKKRRKQYSAGAIIWIIFKYVSLVFFSFVAVIPHYFLRSSRIQDWRKSISRRML